MYFLVSLLSESNILDDEWQYTIFRATPKMSTYLFAFAVVDDSFKSIPSPSSDTDRVEINVGYMSYRMNLMQCY